MFYGIEETNQSEKQFDLKYPAMYLVLLDKFNCHSFKGADAFKK